MGIAIRETISLRTIPLQSKDLPKRAEYRSATRIRQRTAGITTLGHCGTKQTARVKTSGDVVTEYEFHPESKCADASGSVCQRQTVGLLQRRHVKIDQIKCIGKESNSLEDVDAGMEHSGKAVYTEYADPKRDEWTTKIQPALKRVPLKLLVKQCADFLSRRALINLRAGRSKPHRRNRELLKAIVSRYH
jgi:hypothetical protein